MILTKQQVEALRTNGAFTTATIRALGLRFPLKQGWARELVGSEISERMYERALAGVGVYSRSSLRKRRNEVGGHPEMKLGMEPGTASPPPSPPPEETAVVRTNELEMAVQSLQEALQRLENRVRILEGGGAPRNEPEDDYSIVDEL